MTSSRRRMLVASALAVALLGGCAGSSGSAGGAGGDGPGGRAPDDAPPPPPTSTSTSTSTSTGSLPAVDADCHRAGTVDRDVTYRAVPSGVDPALVSLDVHRLGPGCTGAPVWVWVHGGGWTIGDKADHLADKEALARARGWVLVSVGYRLSPGPASAPVAWPDHDDDVAAAVAWIHHHAASIGGDPDRLLLSGHSAGAGITAAVAGDPRYLRTAGSTPAAIRCAAVFDTDGYDVVAGARDPASRTLYRQAFGPDPAVWEAASPIRHLATDGTVGDQFVVTRGTRTRRDAAAAYVAAVEAVGAEAELLDARGLTHAEVNAAIGRPGDAVVTPAFTTWAEGCLGP